VALVVLVITGDTVLIVINSGDDPEPDAFVAVTVAFQLPPVVGVPEIRPAEFIESPGGSLLAPKLVGLLLAVTWKLKDWPVCPDGNSPLVIAGDATAAVTEGREYFAAK
jgi:hypothetical protein